MDEKKEVENVMNETSEPEMVECDVCIFKTKNEERMKRHKFENHSVIGKYVCIQCKREFDTRKLFNNHNFYGC